MINKEQIKKDLKKLGVCEGDLLLVHASLSRIGKVENGPNDVIDALLEVLGAKGTLLMPSFQSGSQFQILSEGGVFDLRKSPSELGAITEEFRKRDGVLRSINPTHCTAGIGPLANEILMGHEHCKVSTGFGSPFEKVGDYNGKILLLGVDHSANTTLHFIENTNGAPTLSSILFTMDVIDLEGIVHRVETYSHMPPGLSRNYPLVEPILLEEGIQKNGHIGNADSKLIDAKNMIKAISPRIKENPLFLIDAFQP